VCIEAARRVFPRCWFNEFTTEAGRDALGYYHAKEPLSLETPIGDEEDSHLGDFVEDKNDLSLPLTTTIRGPFSRYARIAYRAATRKFERRR
jgi:Sigma-70 region 3